MSTLKQLLSRKLNWVDTLFTIVALFLSPIPCRLVTELAALFLAIFFVGSLISRSAWLGIARNVSFILLWAFWFSPFDIAIRDSSSFSFRVVRVVSIHDNRAPVRQLEAQGMRENRDFVVYRCIGVPVRTRWALLATIPTTMRIRTPFGFARRLDGETVGWLDALNLTCGCRATGVVVIADVAARCDGAVSGRAFPSLSAQPMGSHLIITTIELTREGTAGYGNGAWRDLCEWMWRVVGIM